MKELVMKKRSELEDICYKTHIEPDSNTAAEKSNAMIDSGVHVILKPIAAHFYHFRFVLQRNSFKNLSVIQVLWILVNFWQILRNK